MVDITEIKKNEIGQILEFYYFLKDYGHIYNLDPIFLDVPFDQILDGISQIKKIIDNSYGM